MQHLIGRISHPPINLSKQQQQHQLHRPAQHQAEAAAAVGDAPCAWLVCTFADHQTTTKTARSIKT